MSPDLIQLVTDLFRWDHAVKDMPGLDTFGRKEVGVIVESFDWKC
jgi:hypothetical protein